MSIFNRRNAFFGWVAWQIMKQVLERKARSAVAADSGRRRPSVPAIAAVVALVAGGVLFWRNWRAEPEPEL